MTSHPASTLQHVAIGRPITKKGVSVFPVYRPGAAEHPLGLCRPNGGFIVREKATPTVPTLEVENLNAEPVVLFAGETLEGGRQQRVLNQSVIIAGRTITDIPVSCVEQGRWHGAHQFRGVGAMAPPEVRRSAHRGDQMEVWNSVSRLLGDHHLESPTMALDEFFQRRGETVDQAVVDEVASWGPLPEQNGIVVMSRGRVVSADVFGDTELLASMWGTLVASAFSAAGEGRASSTTNRADKALSFLRRFARDVRGPAGRSDFGLGEWRQVMSDRLTGQALALDGCLVHASAFPTAA